MLRYYREVSTWIVNQECVDKQTRWCIRDEEEIKDSKQNYSWGDIPSLCTLGNVFSYSETRKGIKLFCDPFNGCATKVFKQWKTPNLEITKEIEYKEREPSLRELSLFPVSLANEYMRQHFEEVQVIFKA